eukprot:GEZU01014422.1.p1 GENE.GEZU01014422.1~~GEZU01014422.1.p1  ORF type:complete len:271 (+),score=63.68 GEZU01014422.1:321-1133(+)
MPSPSQTESPSGRKSKGTADSQSLTPVTIRQLLTAQAGRDDAFRIDGNHELGLVTFIGKIIKVEELTTNNTYTLDDGTGMIEVKIWVDSNEHSYTASKKHEWRENVYVRVYGHLRSWHGSNSVMSFRMQVIQDFNEVTFHLLDVIRTHLYNKHGPLPEPDQVKQEGGNANYNNNRRNVNANFNNNNNAGYANNYGGDDYANNGFTDVQNAVLNTIVSMSGSVAGASVDDVYNQLGSMFNQDDISNALNFLLTEGHIFQTTDDNHFKPTNQ